MKIYWITQNLSMVLEAHTYNLNYLEGCDCEDRSLRPVQAKNSKDPISKIARAKWTGVCLKQ
jgi:hypothetical protein